MAVGAGEAKRIRMHDGIAADFGDSVGVLRRGCRFRPSGFLLGLGAAFLSPGRLLCADGLRSCPWLQTRDLLLVAQRAVEVRGPLVVGALFAGRVA